MGSVVGRDCQTGKTAGRILQAFWAAFSHQNERYKRIWLEVYQRIITHGN